MQLTASFLFISATAAFILNSTKTELDVVKTAVLPDGQIIDWVRRESQDVNFTLPHDYDIRRRSTLIEQFATPIPEDLQGPEGTVPVARRGNMPPFPTKQMPPDIQDDSDDTASKRRRRRQDVIVYYDYSGRHWYASTSRPAIVTGGGASVSIYKPYLESQNDFSLMQTAVVRFRARPWGRDSNGNRVLLEPIRQTVEAGWMHYPSHNADKVTFFTFFSANGYSGVGDYMSGWNAEQRGWVQVDRDVYPGMVFDRYSERGGDQLEMDLQYRLEKDENGGRWWLRALGRDIGYYPANMFLLRGYGGDGEDSSYDESDDYGENTLASYGDRLDFYGEVYNSGMALTATDMGSGEFPSAGDYHVAYFRNMYYFNSEGKKYQFVGYTQATDSSRYDIKTFWNSPTSWASYVYLGGPGAHGVVDG